MITTIGFDTSALDTSFKAHAQRGIGRYVRELTKFFDANGNLPVKIRNFDHNKLKVPLFDSLVNLLPLGRQTVRQQFLYPFSLAGNETKDSSMLHFPAHMDAPSWGMKKYIVTVLDLIPLVCRDLYKSNKPNWRFAFGRWLELRAIKNAALIIAISENTARDVERIFGYPRERIVVTPLGVDEKFFSVTRSQGDQNEELRRKFRIPVGRPIVLYVGGIDQRKNMDGLLKSFNFALHTQRTQNKPLPILVMAGKIEDDAEYPKLVNLMDDLNLRHDIVMPGYVSESDLLSIYGLSDVFFFPSLYEGFGLTPLEALAAGVPVVSSNTSSMPEVLSDAAILVSPTDHAACAEKIVDLLQNNEFAQSFIDRGKARARVFSWARTGEETVKAYQKCAALYA